MVRTRSDLEGIIEKLTQELNQTKEFQIKAELECEKLRQGLKNALAVTSTYEKLIQELEEENKNLVDELSRYRNGSNSNSDTLLEESLQALNMMRTKVREEKELSETLRQEISHLKQTGNGENHEHFRLFADRLCEELVLLDEDLSFVSKFVKPPEEDIYKSNKGGRNPKTRSPYPGNQEFPEDLALEDDDSDRKGDVAPNLLFGENHRKPPGYSIHHLHDSPKRIEETEEGEENEDNS